MSGPQSLTFSTMLYNSANFTFTAAPIRGGQLLLTYIRAMTFIQLQQQ
jgi:hypothetical protein